MQDWSIPYALVFYWACGAAAESRDVSYLIERFGFLMRNLLRIFRGFVLAFAGWVLGSLFAGTLMTSADTSDPDGTWKIPCFIGIFLVVGYARSNPGLVEALGLEQLHNLFKKY